MQRPFIRISKVFTGKDIFSKDSDYIIVKHFKKEKLTDIGLFGFIVRILERTSVNLDLWIRIDKSFNHQSTSNTKMRQFPGL